MIKVFGLLVKGRAIAKKVKNEIQVYRLLLKDKRTPLLAKILLLLAVGYLLLPFDLIPDFIPILGQFDDAVIIPLLVVLALWLTPAKVLEDCRKKICIQ